ncbi:hypothetical protein COO60DRAFT_596529 [Scenedesmus sp. NREL 46B-D3]|nr:hypothetical protein COO60DRAFT_596529 [Scenedesmus sp. NREL 46B-D3]
MFLSPILIISGGTAFTTLLYCSRHRQTSALWHIWRKWQQQCAATRLAIKRQQCKCSNRCLLLWPFNPMMLSPVSCCSLASWRASPRLGMMARCDSWHAMQNDVHEATQHRHTLVH